jgi:nucleoid-associated protein YgaU
MAYVDTNRRKQRFVFSNNNELYDDILRRKRIRSARQYSTLVLERIQSTTTNGIQEVTHIWTTGDRYYKLASQFYGRAELWWVIALYNQKPTEGHLKRGDLIRIPVPIELVLYYL